MKDEVEDNIIEVGKICHTMITISNAACIYFRLIAIFYYFLLYNIASMTYVSLVKLRHINYKSQQNFVIIFINDILIKIYQKLKCRNF